MSPKCRKRAVGEFSMGRVNPYKTRSLIYDYGCVSATKDKKYLHKPQLLFNYVCTLLFKSVEIFKAVVRG
jgi:hypothetical protein